MERLKCMVVDDEHKAIALMRKYIRGRPDLLLVHATADPRGIAALVRQYGVALLFLDLEMPGINGLEILAQLGERIRVVVCTAHADRGSECIDAGAVDFLVKPFDRARFGRAVDRAKQKGKEGMRQVLLDDGRLVLPGIGKGKFIQLLLDDVDYIEADEHTVVIHTIEATLQGGIAIGELEKLLPPNKFLRIHKSYIVALDRMRRVESGRLHGMRLQSDIGLPVGLTYKAALLDYLNRRMPGGPNDGSTDG
ncbi:LytR/AlgR family response regulator transcription factor [Parapedobacter koreensis]|uniref:Two component transcriptional regulator, LytTR family n=1 Tax=Parapedobacter koreensis TaxID=332977 RepID=A0A1H7HVA7_9SPHI|nr:LytTR family DNA-binding domain-containing protein [Parapedobacter koreensis]SEK53587.1 two component transcriptional regulator, LytTR family [Parapedobacter koreensis]